MFSKALIATCFAALAAAQSAVLTFTHVPNPITDGQAQAITYTTNDTTTPVTILLRKGASLSLQTVSTLTTSATGGQFIWTPPKSLANGIDYALQITQGSQINYFGPFTIQGADPSAVASASSASATVSSSSAATNATTTTAVVAVPGTVGTMSAGTGTALPRNTTMSMATLTPSGSATVTAATNSAGQTTGSGYQGSSTASSASATSTSGASSITISGALSLLFGAAAAALYL